MWRRTGVALALGVMAVGFHPPVASAQYYKGKQIDVIVGSEAGSGYDAYSRMLSRYLGRHLPGAPSVVVKNMPGAESRLAANYIENIAPKDGTAIGGMIHGLAVDELLGAPGIHFESRKLTWLGSINQDLIVGFAWHTSPVKTVEEAMQREMIVGGVADSLVFATLMNSVLGTKFKIITGYRGGAELSLAMERGEIEGRMGWAWSSMMAGNAEWLRDGKIIPMVQFSTTRHPSLPNVPTIADFAHSDDDRALFALVFSRQALGKPYIAASGLSSQVKTILRAAFDDTMRDADFLAEMEKAKLDVSPMSGAAVETLVANLFTTRPEVIEKAKMIIPMEH